MAARHADDLHLCAAELLLEYPPHLGVVKQVDSRDMFSQLVTLRL